MCVSATAGDADVRLLATDQSFPVRRCKFFNKSGSTTRTCLQEKDLPPFTEESIYIRSGAHLYTCILLSSSLSLLPHRRRRCSASCSCRRIPFPFQLSPHPPRAASFARTSFQHMLPCSSSFSSLWLSLHTTTHLPAVCAMSSDDLHPSIYMIEQSRGR